jgi:hypothetical protein
MNISGITQVDSITPTQVGSTVIKGGYKTGWTRGLCDGTKSQCKFPGGPEGGTAEYCIVSSKPGIPLSLGGDSGAWVLRPNGKLGGMVIGGVLDGRWSYMTPIETVIEDIEDAVGGILSPWASSRHSSHNKCQRMHRPDASNFQEISLVNLFYSASP